MRATHNRRKMQICNISRPSSSSSSSSTLREIDGNIAFFLLMRIFTTHYAIHFQHKLRVVYALQYIVCGACLGPGGWMIRRFCFAFLFFFVIFGRRSTLSTHLQTSLQIAACAFPLWMNELMWIWICCVCLCSCVADVLSKINDGDVMKGKIHSIKIQTKRREKYTRKKRKKRKSQINIPWLFIVWRIDAIIYLLLSKFRVWGVSLLMAFLDSCASFFPRSPLLSLSFARHSPSSHFNSFILFFFCSIVARVVTIQLDMYLRSTGVCHHNL